MIRPPALGPGSRVAVIAPAGPPEKARLEAGLDRLRALGYEPVLGENVLRRHLHQAGTPDERLSDLLWSLSDPTISGVVCARGGEGATALLPWLEAAEVQPRVFCGYSDVTALHAWLQRNGWITFHGPMVATEMDKAAGFDASSFTGEVTGVRSAPSIPVKLLRGGQAEGTLTGGCLSILTSLSGTEWALPWTGRSVLLLEDVGEPPYKLHRMLVQLRDAGGLRDVQGILFGAMEGCAPSSTDGFTLEDVLLDALGGFEGPVAIGAPLGHCSAPMLTLPLGARVLLSADDAGSTGAGRLHLLEPGVSDDVVVDLDA